MKTKTQKSKIFRESHLWNINNIIYETELHNLDELSRDGYTDISGIWNDACLALRPGT